MSKVLQDPAEAQSYSQSWAKGYSDGLASARRVAAAEAAQAEKIREELFDSIDQQAMAGQARLQVLLAQLASTELPVVEEAADAVLEAAFSIASSILGVALDNPQLRALSVHARAGAHESRKPLELRVHPQDVPELQSMGLPWAIVPDSSLSPGDFKANYPEGWIDGILAGAVDRARREMERQVNAH